jgi:phospholipid/cholesterol/gamma-HCH transport system substrate-binding protein
MEQESTKYTKLGIFVLIGIIFFIFILALIGRQNNVFESTFRVYARFSNIEGLQKGSNIWFSGVKIGVVKDVVIESTNSVQLELKLSDDYQPFIKKDAKAKIGSDGLLGNKIVVISGGSEEAAAIVEGDVLEAETGLNTDDLLATFKVTNDNLAKITDDVSVILADIRQGKGSVGSLIKDSVIYQDLKASMNSANLATRNSARITQDLSKLVNDINQGEGMVGALLKDTAYENRIDRTLIDIEKTADEAAVTSAKLNEMSAELKSLMTKLDDPNAPVGKLLNDSTFATTLEESMTNLKESSSELDKTLEKAQESFLLRRRIFRRNKEDRKKNK